MYVLSFPVVFSMKACQQVQEKSPLKYVVVRCSFALSPTNMVRETELSKARFEKLAYYLHESERVSIW